jgi:Na+-transporting NADH:ubiquinone oxidoreductase subunit NqrB
MIQNEETLELEDLAYLLTHLLVSVNPAIDEGQTFDILCEMLGAEYNDEFSAKRYGAMIRATAFDTPDTQH